MEKNSNIMRKKKTLCFSQLPLSPETGFKLTLLPVYVDRHKYRGERSHPRSLSSYYFLEEIFFYSGDSFCAEKNTFSIHDFALLVFKPKTWMGRGGLSLPAYCWFLTSKLRAPQRFLLPDTSPDGPVNLVGESPLYRAQSNTSVFFSFVHPHKSLSNEQFPIIEEMQNKIPKLQLFNS